MSNLCRFLFLAICATVFAVTLSPTANAGGIGTGMEWINPSKTTSCKGSIADCMEDGEFDLDNEINRRILVTTKYISYPVLQKNTVPCSRRGVSYYNCQLGAQANPYRRPCSAIKRCRS